MVGHKERRNAKCPLRKALRNSNNCHFAASRASNWNVWFPEVILRGGLSCRELKERIRQIFTWRLITWHRVFRLHFSLKTLKVKVGGRRVEGRALRVRQASCRKAKDCARCKTHNVRKEKVRKKTIFAQLG